MAFETDEMENTAKLHMKANELQQLETSGSLMHVIEQRETVAFRTLLGTMYEREAGLPHCLVKSRPPASVV